jgi:myosin heavy subunit
MGILSLLEEECVMPKGSDQGFADKLYQRHFGKTAKFDRPKLTKRTTVMEHFSIEHYAGVVSCE